MQLEEMINALEAIIFASGDPLAKKDLEKIFARLFAGHEDKEGLLGQLSAALEGLQSRWSDGGDRGFTLMEVAGGWAFRSNPRWGDAVQAMREQRPVRLSKAALEILSIVAYRQPVTKPEVDDIRGVDCGGSLRLLLERGLVRITGKKEEPGRPLLYGTTREFLSFFNLGNLAQLPTLREFHELTDESAEELAAFDGVSVEELADSARKLRLDEEPAVAELEEAITGLKHTEHSARDALASEGIALEEAPADAATPGARSDATRPEGAGAGAETTPAKPADAPAVVTAPATAQSGRPRR